MLGQPKKTWRKPSLSATCCILEPGSVMARKRRPASFAPTSCETRSKKYCLKMFGSRVEPDLLETMKIVFFKIDFVLERLHLGRVGGIEHVQFGKSADLPEGHLHHFRTEARAAHAQQQDMREAGALGHFANLRQPLDMSQLAIGDAEPAEPLRFIFAGPKRCVSAPKLSHFTLCTPLRQRAFYRSDRAVREVCKSGD